MGQPKLYSSFHIGPSPPSHYVIPRHTVASLEPKNTAWFNTTTSYCGGFPRTRCQSPQQKYNRRFCPCSMIYIYDTICGSWYFESTSMVSWIITAFLRILHNMNRDSNPFLWPDPDFNQSTKTGSPKHRIPHMELKMSKSQNAPKPVSADD